eukprot:6186975-Pleurochrysis_carterae.AAC.2
MRCLVCLYKVRSERRLRVYIDANATLAPCGSAIAHVGGHARRAVPVSSGPLAVSPSSPAAAR